jgi:hypothetical protein
MKWQKEGGLRQCLINLSDQTLSPDNLPAKSKNEGQLCPSFQHDKFLSLAANTKFFDHNLITFDVGFFQVIEQTTSLTNNLQQSAAGMMIFFVGPKVFGQVSDPLGEQSDLDFRGTGITLMFLKFTNYFLFTIRGEH